MKALNICTAVVLAALATQVQSSEPPKDSPKPIASGFPTGGWATTAELPETVIAVGIPASIQPFLFLVYSPIHTAAPDLRYTITVDGAVLSPSTSEGTGTLVEGKNISLRQMSAEGSSIGGTWRAIYPQNDPWITSSSQWMGFPNQVTLIASFATPRLAVIGLDLDTKDCPVASFQVLVDDAELKHQNKVITWPRGGSVLSYGKKFAVKVLGQCTARMGASGGITYAFPK